MPLLLALLTQLIAKRSPTGLQFQRFTAWLPVPMMALVLFIVVASQISRAIKAQAIISDVLPIYLLFICIMPFVAIGVAKVFRLEAVATRTLIFSTATRNSLIVLPLALALPSKWATVVAAVIVTQTMTELVGELIYIKILPKFIR